MRAYALIELTADRAYGAKGRACILKNHRDLFACKFSPCILGKLQNIRPFPKDFSRTDARVQDAHDRPQNCALAAARLPRKDEDLPAMQAKIHAAHRLLFAVRNREIPHGEKRCIAHDFFSKSALTS